MAERVAITHQRYELMAECEDCDRLHPDSTRERCRLHVRQTGHKVRFVIEDVTTYTPAEARDDPHPPR